ncbi:MAG TPA: MMPL family transporter [Anaerohalosphaeraceae bacterium]|nr:MMPL family transporter [Anaerohalosphaeraceae bacterium]HOL31742.1 MMPL family transporter [Anaerohalosphaeraceae bacterium]HOM75470.1 MMPL family transporter [Anaerohalosphaeraceae bacterium]HPC63802.1 MMPL family transporter [Anaerohalosphaeraceae bacterium]HPO70106.1 MMPL family transporter [Anaerohalosphaeraceae bacterium]
MKVFSESVVQWSVAHYKLVTAAMIVFTLCCGAFIPLIQVDTDPENMLSPDEAVRVFHNQTKKQFDLSDIVVLGIINERNEYGVFNPATLQRIYELTEFAKTLNHLDKKDPQRLAGVIEVDMIAPSLIDHIGQGGPGVITFEWLMPQPPQTQAEALEIRDKALSNPLLNGTMVSEDGKALCLYIPLTDKHFSYRVYSELNKKIAQMGGEENFYITGLPVAEDTFGVEMFIQMAVSAPLAMLTIFILMLIFFRKLILVIAPMIIAMVSVISTMGLLIGFRYPVHIMSSMIPIFLMPIAVVDSVHILSEFFEVYTKQKGRRQAVLDVMQVLFAPMLYTSLTSAAGFLSLALTPIPPVQVFGVFVAVGIMIAWIFTVTFIPAYVMLIPEKFLATFGRAVSDEDKPGIMTRLLHSAGGLTCRYAKPILAALAVLTGLAGWGIAKIQINDNPVKWFSKRHPIRIADIALNRHFGGTYMAYLILDGQPPQKATTEDLEYIRKGLAAFAAQIQQDYANAPILAEKIQIQLDSLFAASDSYKGFLDAVVRWIDTQAKNAPDEEYYTWDELRVYFGIEGERLKVFKRPDVLNYMAALQSHLEQTGLVGKSNSVADIVRKINQELVDGRPENYRIPEQLQGVAECYVQFQQSHRPKDLWHFLTPDYLHANIWMQLTSGDNKDMEQVVRAVEDYFAAHKPPVELTYHWAGLTYINTVWQEKMVFGMLQSFLGSFLVVFIMMAVLFRSPLWGLLCMVPLTITIAAIYGTIGFIGKDYDMPVAVLSALTLGMAVDFAIHFLQRSRETHQAAGSWAKAAPQMFGEPARAISRNILVIAIGFLPLLAAPLVPYKTVGIFLCAIMAVSGFITLAALPAVLTVAEKYFFKAGRKIESVGCNCSFCIIIAVSVAALVALNLHQYWQVGFTKLTGMSIALIPVLVLVCGLMSRRKACQTNRDNQISREDGGVK